MTEALRKAENYNPDLAIDLLEHIGSTNDLDYTITKTVEELNELSTVLMQHIHKRGGIKQPPLKDIVDEIGDVVLRLDILAAGSEDIFGTDITDAVSIRVHEKLGKYFKFIKDGKYQGKL